MLPSSTRPRQTSLHFPRDPAPDAKRSNPKHCRWDECAARNLECAHIILAEPDRYAGLPVEWARLVVSAAAPAVPPYGRVASKNFVTSQHKVNL